MLDAAVQTINALHKVTPFDFGISLGDDCNNSQYNELRWFLDTIDGKVITPSSGAHRGASTIDYQKPFYAAGLNPEISWYQVIGNHDQFWMGSAFECTKTRSAHIGNGILNIADDPHKPDIQSTGAYMGVVDGSTIYGNIYGGGPVADFTTPPSVIADSNRHTMASLTSTTRNWMSEFFNTTTQSRRSRIYPGQSRPGHRLLQLCAQVRYPHQVHCAGRYGEGTGPGQTTLPARSTIPAISGWSANSMPDRRPISSW